MADANPQLIVRDFAPGDESAIARIKLGAIADGSLPGEDAESVLRWAESLTVEPSGTVVAELDGHVVGFLSPNEHQVVVDRAFRRRRVASRLVAFAEPASSPLLLWLPDGNEAANPFFDSIGYVYYSSLWEVTIAPDKPIPEPAFPDDLDFTEWEDIDLDEFVRVFNTAFADHPTPLATTRELVEWAKSQPGNETFAYLLIRPRDTGELIGIARSHLARTDDGATGEVDFIGLLPAWRGRGLGRALLLWAVANLRERGAGSVTLHVEAQNRQALALYESTGFVQSHEWRRYARQ